MSNTDLTSDVYRREEVDGATMANLARSSVRAALAGRLGLRKPSTGLDPQHPGRARARWQNTDCPKGCAGGHRDDDNPGDRRHVSEFETQTELTREAPHRHEIRGRTFTDPADVVAYVEWADCETEPVITFEAQLATGVHRFQMTVDEAQAQASGLAKAAALGREWRDGAK